ncbi:MAG TPA: glycosyltransferase [Acidimicrobiia bacterium]|jgi:mannosylglucosylglycerate synthase|nr:glycosyltransferase [Acidimicrobiia bacterium]
MAREAVLLSYRLGGSDGVSVEAAKWDWALQSLGFTVRRVAGERCDAPRREDVVLPAFAITGADSARPNPQQLAAALDGADLVVAANICSLPINVDAAGAARDALARHRGRVAFHHHDLPWQRAELAAVRGFPPAQPGALHVVVNDRSREGLAERGITAHTIRNTFDFDAPGGDRAAARAAFGFTDAELVVLQPTRAIPRKNVPGGLRFGEALAGLVRDRRVVYWLTGPAEDGYGPTLVGELEATALPVTLGRTARPMDAYAAADVVAFPSTWEGFGNPVIESAVARRPLAALGYPVLNEIVASGMRVFSVEDPGEVAAWLASPDPVMLEANRELVRRDFSLADLPGRLDAAFAAAGWSSW